MSCGGGATTLSVLPPTPTPPPVVAPTATAEPVVAPTDTPAPVLTPRPALTTSPPALSRREAPSTVDDDHGNDISSATPISTDASYVAVINYGGDVDFFSFTTQRGTTYVIETILGSLDDSNLYLFDSTDSQIDFNDDFGGSSNSRIEWIAPSTQTYYVAVSAGDASETGRYSLSVSLP